MPPVNKVKIRNGGTIESSNTAGPTARPMFSYVRSMTFSVSAEIPAASRRPRTRSR